MHQILAHRTGPQRRAEVDGGVQRLLGKVEGFAAGGDVNGHVRVQRGKVGQPGDQPAGAKGGQHGQVQQATAVRPGHGFLRGSGQLLQHSAHIGGVDAACIGQHHALAHAVEHGHAELCLQLANLARYRALRQVQFFGRARDAGVAGGGFKGQQVGDGRKKAFAQHSDALLE